MSHLKTPEIVTGARRYAVVQDEANLQILQAILVEMKMMNVHLSILSDLSIEASDFDQLD